VENSAKFNVSVIGEKSGQPFNGDFTVKTRLTRSDYFRADEIRRSLLGVRPEAASPAVAGEAFVFAQLSVRITEAPKWWEDAQNGLELEDPNVIGTIFKLAVEKEEERVAKIQEESKAALTKIAAKTKKAE
jgi:hypothetical protein